MECSENYESSTIDKLLLITYVSNWNLLKLFVQLEFPTWKQNEMTLSLRLNFLSLKEDSHIPYHFDATLKGLRLTAEIKIEKPITRMHLVHFMPQQQTLLMDIGLFIVQIRFLFLKKKMSILYRKKNSLFLSLVELVFNKIHSNSYRIDAMHKIYSIIIKLKSWRQLNL